MIGDGGDNKNVPRAGGTQTPVSYHLIVCSEYVQADRDERLFYMCICHCDFCHPKSFIASQWHIMTDKTCQYLSLHQKPLPNSFKRRKGVYFQATYVISLRNLLSTPGIDPKRINYVLKSKKKTNYHKAYIVSCGIN